MFRRQLIALTIIVVSSSAASAQVRAFSGEPGQARTYTFSTNSEDGDRAVVGVTTSTGSARDTLGVLLNSVTAGGPADKAGIEEGSRVASINGVNLKLSPADVGDWDMASAMQRRFTREMAKVKAGDEVELRVYNSGQTRTVKVKTVTYDDLYTMQRRTVRERDLEDRAALGVSLGSSGSKRDTLGVLIMGLDDDSPAAKAGLEEGNRIQSINGVDLRVSRDDAGDVYLGGTKVRRLQRELEKVKVGDEVTLKVYTGAGRTRDVKIKTVPQSDFRKRSGMSFFGTTPMAFPMPAMPMEPEVRLRFQDEMGRVRERLEQIAPAARALVRNRIVI